LRLTAAPAYTSGDALLFLVTGSKFIVGSGVGGVIYLLLCDLLAVFAPALALSVGDALAGRARGADGRCLVGLAVVIRVF